MPKADPPKQARPFSFADDEPPGGVVAMLRTLAKRAAEDGADPSAVVAADFELLLVCDALIAQMGQVDEAFAAWTAAVSFSHGPCDDKLLKQRRALTRSLMLRATKLKAETPRGLFAKAAAVRRVGKGAADLAVSLAGDLLASPALRAAIWPAGDPK